MMNGNAEALKAVVVGCGMGANHARAMAGLDEYELVAVCDIDEERATGLAEGVGGVRVYTDYREMIAETRPDVVAVATPTSSHAEITIHAAEAGARGICCEKPVAKSMGQARTMAETCEARGIPLIFNHQRRLHPAYVAMRRLIEEGAIGDLYLVRGTCGGQVVTDGTHTVDLLFHLAGDPEVEWVFGQVYRDRPDPSEEKAEGRNPSGGYRYGHPIETGAIATFQFGTGVRAEMLIGGVRFPGRPYQDLEAFGTVGRLWRSGDRAEPPLLIRDEEAGGWRPAPLNLSEAEADQLFPMRQSYTMFARTIREGAPHPLCAANALREFEVLMAVYESARLNARIELPLQQDEFPLELMIEEGRA